MSIYRTDLWQKPLDDYYRAYAGIPLDSTSGNTAYYKNRRFSLILPESALRMSGFLNDKIRFFKNPVFANENSIAKILNNPDYTGNVVLLSEKSSLQNTFVPQPEDNRAIQLNYIVTDYSPNSISIDVATNEKSGLYLFYSDIWHPSWKAYVDGKPQKIEKANLAYKAVRLPDGEKNVNVKFIFEDPLGKTLVYILFFNCTLWLFGLIYLIFSILRGKDD